MVKGAIPDVKSRWTSYVRMEYTADEHTHTTKDEHIDGRIWLLFITSVSERSISASYALSHGYL